MSKFKYPNDPQDAKCPYCGEKGKPCSNVEVWQGHMLVVLVRRKMLKKILHFLERDQDITLYEEFH